MYGLGFAKSRRGPDDPSPMVAQAELPSADRANATKHTARSVVGGDSLELPTSWV